MENLSNRLYDDDIWVVRFSCHLPEFGGVNVNRIFLSVKRTRLSAGSLSVFALGCMWRHTVTTLLSVFKPVCTFISFSNVHLWPKDAHWCGTVKIKYLFYSSTAHIKCNLKWYLNRWSLTTFVVSLFLCVKLCRDNQSVEEKVLFWQILII